MKQNRKILLFLILWHILGGLVSQFLFQFRLLEFLGDFLILILFFRTNRYSLKWNIRAYIGRNILGIISLFLITGVVSGLLNIQSPVTILWGFRMFARYYLLFYSACKCLDEQEIVKMTRIIQKLFLFNLFFIVFEALVLHIKGDPLGGTFAGGNSAFVNFFIPCMALLSCDYFQGKVKKKYLVLVTCLTFYFALAGESKIIYFILPSIICAAYVLQKKFSFGRLIVLGVFPLVAIPVMEYFIRQYYGEEYANRVFDTEAIDKETSGTGFGGDFNRSTQIEMAHKYFLTAPLHTAIGYGFGVGSTSDLFGSDFGLRYKYTVFQGFSASYLLAETGWTGFVLYVLGHIILLYRFYLFYRRYQKNNVIRYWSSIGLITVGITFLMMWYNNDPVRSYNFFYYIWAMCFVSIHLQIIRLKQATNERT